MKKVAFLQFLSYYPLKQGLKLPIDNYRIKILKIFILLSIKTRIETKDGGMRVLEEVNIFILLSIKTRIET